jgi:ribosomal protein S4
MAASNSEARRLIDQGGVKVDGSAVVAGTYVMEVADFVGKPVQVGKRRWCQFSEPVE